MVKDKGCGIVSVLALWGLGFKKFVDTLKHWGSMGMGKCDAM